MSSHGPDVIDGEFAGLGAELRATPPETPPDLRDRVKESPSGPGARDCRAAASAGRLRHRQPRRPSRGAVAVGVLPSSDPTAVPQPGGRPDDAQAGGHARLGASGPRSPGKARPAVPAAVTLRVEIYPRNAGGAPETRGLGGYVRAVDYGRRESGTPAAVRVPISGCSRRSSGSRGWARSSISTSPCATYRRASIAASGGLRSCGAESGAGRG